MLVFCLLVGAFIWIVLSPLFASLNVQAAGLYSGPLSHYYPDNVRQNTVWIFQFIWFSIVLFFIFVVGYYLKGYLQPWMRGYK